MINRRELGRLGEQAAEKYLIGRGYAILMKNYRFSRYGEIDIIAKSFETYCFIEVKTRADKRYGTPAEAVSRAKQHKILTVASHYINTVKKPDSKMRFDVVEIFFSIENAAYNVLSIKHIENAFGAF